MTEAEWLAAPDAYVRVKHLTRMKENRPSDRKLRLVVCAACRLFWDQFADAPVYRQAVEVVERFADGTATTKELQQIDKRTRNPGAGTTRAFTAVSWLTWGPWRGYDNLGTAIRSAIAYAVEEAGKEDPALPALTRCIFGNPFRPVVFNPAWRTSTVAALARGIYDERAFERMPILADALQDAGCDNDDVLNHCRTDTVHARGCWVVDAVLGKA